MIDTVRGKVARPWHRDLMENPPKGWDIRQGTIMNKEGEETVLRTAVHVNSGMYIKGDDFGSHVMQVSMPRLLHGDNVKLIRSQEEIDKAMDLIRINMLKVMQLDAIPTWTRIDLVWNFKGNINDFIACFQNSKHPRVRSAVRVYLGESISWKGKKVELQIYDKLQEKGSINLKKGNETIVRAEVRQRVNAWKMNDENEPYDKLTEPCIGGHRISFEKAYNYYRSLLILLSPKTIPDIVSRSPMDFLAYLQANHLTDKQGVPLVDIWMKDKSRATKYRTMRELKARVVRHKLINWNCILPEDRPPIPVDRSDFQAA